MINLFPLLVDNFNRLETFEFDWREFAYPNRCWHSEWVFSAEPREAESWAFLLKPTTQPVFRAGWISECFFEYKGARWTCRIAVIRCGHQPDGTFFVIGTLLPNT